ncbi:hypothetical protein EZS27_028137 [termite gut metagenome]|uniref:Uncharacterized protein n=1 Tax=termite gut metagenome TaxID=433724 RepID=A0A5J4QNQ2_9ZZZZ
MNIQAFKDILSLSNKVNSKELEIERNTFNKVIGTLNKFSNLYKSLEKQLPYHINLLDLLWANENAHSRILAHLLKQHSDKGFEICQSFITYIATRKGSFSLINVDTPIITAEGLRIDALIQEQSKYALIIENKIHWANDQSNQLACYIDKVKGLGYDDSLIYVIYLTRDGNKTVDPQSWQKSSESNNTEESYEEAFKERFIPLSYRDDILPWLKKEVLPNCRIKDNFLRSALEQYIDHLEGMFDLRINNMNNELQEFIKKELGMTAQKTPEENYSIVSNKVEEIGKMMNQLELLKQKTKIEVYWKKWITQLKQDYPNREIIDKTKNPSEDDNKIGIIVAKNNLKFAVLMKRKEDGRIYYGIGRHYCGSKELLSEVSEFIKPLIENGFKPATSWWYGRKYITPCENGYNELKTFIDEVIKFTEL